MKDNLTGFGSAAFSTWEKGISPLDPAFEVNECSSKVDHDPYGVVGGFRGFVSLKMVN